MNVPLFPEYPNIVCRESNDDEEEKYRGKNKEKPKMFAGIHDEELFNTE